MSNLLLGHRLVSHQPRPLACRVTLWAAAFYHFQYIEYVVIEETEYNLLRFKQSTDTCVTDVDSTMAIHKQQKSNGFAELLDWIELHAQQETERRKGTAWQRCGVSVNREEAGHGGEADEPT